jgi:hypothetical protein
MVRGLALRSMGSLRLVENETIIYVDHLANDTDVAFVCYFNVINMYILLIDLPVLLSIPKMPSSRE